MLTVNESNTIQWSGHYEASPAISMNLVDQYIIN